MAKSLAVGMEWPSTRRLARLHRRTHKLQVGPGVTVAKCPMSGIRAISVCETDVPRSLDMLRYASLATFANLAQLHEVSVADTAGVVHGVVRRTVSTYGLPNVW